MYGNTEVKERDKTKGRLVDGEHFFWEIDI